ncbi:MAG TPA: MerC domain-containing protein [Bacteriovoracaceae bacterium]|nr:MerC domain-containing protein [Bacteriovoracaceae bacterium]
MKKVWDRLGIAFSSACVIHCIFVAFIPLIFPAINYFTHLDWIHGAVAASLLITTPMAFYPGFKKHGLTWIIILACLGITIILLGMALEGKTSVIVSHSASIVGSILLVTAHFKNIQHSHKHHHQCC